MALAERYGIWLSWNNKEDEFELPILPGNIGSSISGNGAEHDVVGLGKINVIKDRGLAKYQIESLFPAHPYPFVTAPNLLRPMEYVALIMKWWDSKRPIRFIFTGGNGAADFEGHILEDVNTPVSIEGFEWSEEAGSPGDIQYKLQLKEYKFYAARLEQTNASTQQIAVTSQTRPDDRITPNTYTMAAGDTLWKVAQKMLGDGSRWREIQQLNGITDAEVKRLPIGKVLKLP